MDVGYDEGFQGLTKLVGNDYNVINEEVKQG